MIRKALEKDLINVEGGYRELLIYEKEHGTNSNWVLDLYPTIETAKKAFSADTLYVLELEDKICGSMILNQVQPEDYKEIDWKYKADKSKVFVIHTLCVSPSMARKGIGRKMMEYAENLAKEIGCIVLRLETHAENEPAKALYKSLGFRFAGEGEALLAGVIPEKQVFYEKKL